MISMVELTTKISNLTTASLILVQVNAVNHRGRVDKLKDIDTIDLLSERPGL